MGATLVGEIIRILYSGLTGVASAIGSGLSELAESVFVTGAGTESSPYALTTFGTIIVVFAGISLAVGLSTMVVKWVMSLGARN